MKTCSVCGKVKNESDSTIVTFGGCMVKKSGIVEFNGLSIQEAFEKGLCDKCVAYYPEIVAPFTTHCRSTLGRTMDNVGKCTKRKEV